MKAKLAIGIIQVYTRWQLSSTNLYMRCIVSNTQPVCGRKERFVWFSTTMQFPLTIIYLEMLIIFPGYQLYHKYFYDDTAMDIWKANVLVNVRFICIIMCKKICMSRNMFISDLQCSTSWSRLIALIVWSGLNVQHYFIVVLKILHNNVLTSSSKTLSCHLMEEGWVKTN